LFHLKGKYSAKYFCVTSRYFSKEQSYSIIAVIYNISCDVTMMLLRNQSISYFNVKRTIWRKDYQNGNHIEPSEQRLQEISIAKNWTRAGSEQWTGNRKAASSYPARGQFFAMFISCSRCISCSEKSTSCRMLYRTHYPAGGGFFWDANFFFFETHQLCVQHLSFNNQCF